MPAYRFVVVGVTAVAALWMYIDRVCVSTVAGDVQRDLGLTVWERNFALSAFFLAYGALQIPAGFLADQWGPRRVLAGCVVGWSVATAVTGFVSGFATLLAARLALGVAEAGAYPAAAGLVKAWAGPGERGRLSGVVAAGGRVGGFVAPFLTTFLAVALVGVGPAWRATTTADGGPGGNWRAVFVVYGACGLVVASLFVALVRDRPTGGPAPTAITPGSWRRFGRRVRLLAATRSMWLFGAVLFGVNVAWTFLVTKLPEYLEAQGVEKRDIGALQSGVLAVGATGMLVGGYVTDWLRRVLGPRRGRSVPLAVTLVGCGAVCAAAATVADPWTVIFLLAGMAFLVDFGNPALWGFAQDVGGRDVGTTLGWGNMWGNLAGGLSPIVLTAVQVAAGWAAVFYVCAGSFVLAAAAGLMLDASKPVDDTEPSLPPGRPL